ncbi:hypothetical protein PCANC_07868 [Puccinia coronata f. sp. avenae]|uniref:Uncharacterized protein n=1 Tax=Puccinia coronata f. sp. avenae TaxID=200324 RepID=A0A2N5T8X6_9BASI|nr:hypothetical protein PCASD_12872 [Puccinia coronata f. sp. avenae]PLW47837.1 hypothetical protein PCANC_07868 [Puccinia coronata f. sp. avenae]
MRYLVIVIALLSSKPFQCTELEAVVPATTALQTPEADSSICDMRGLSGIDYMNSKDSREIRDDYAQAKKRLILIGEDDPFNQNGDQQRINAVLSSLAADPRNEIWMVTSRDVNFIENIYGRIENLNLAGYNGMQFSARNKASVKLPDVGLLEKEASQFIKDREIPLIATQKGEHLVRYLFLNQGLEGQTNAEWVNQKLQHAIDTNPTYKEFGVKTFTMFDDHSGVELKPKYSGRKRILAEALLSRDRETPIDFAMSVGINQVDEHVHQAMKSRSHYAILVKKKFLTDSLDNTYASHRLKDPGKLISLLENLAEIKKPNHDIESLGTFLQNMGGIIKVF